MVEAVSPRWVFHAAAMTNVDECELHPADADRSNRVMTENLCACLPEESHFAYISTDQVYPDTDGLHIEGVEGPVNVYGRSKFAGEKAALTREHSLVARTNFFGRSRSAGRSSLSDFIETNLKRRNSITLFRDVFFSPLHAETLAKTVVLMAERMVTGTYNLASRAGLSKSDFALGVAEHLGLQTETADLGDSSSIASRAPRTRDLRMDTSRIENELGHGMPTVEQEIEKL